MQLSDVSRSFADCYTISKEDNSVVLIRGAEPVQEGTRYETEVDPENDNEVLYAVHEVRSERSRTMRPSEMQFLYCPLKFGWGQGQRGNGIYVSLNSRRQWRKGLTRHRISARNVSPTLSSEGKVLPQMTNSMVDGPRFFSSFLSGFFGPKQERSLADATGPLSESYELATQVYSPRVALTGQRSMDNFLLWVEDSPVALFDRARELIVLPKYSEAYLEILADEFPTTEIARSS